MKKVLVIQAARFGDLVQTGKLLKSLTGQYEVHLALDHGLLNLARLLFPDLHLHGFHFHHPPDQQGLSELLEDFKVLSQTEFEYVFNCNFSPNAANLCRLFPVDRIIGLRPGTFSGGDILKSFWVRLVFRLTQKRNYSSLNLVDYWGWFYKDTISGSSYNPVAKPGGKGLGIVMAGRESRRSLPPSILAQITATVCNILKPESIYLFGTQPETPLAHSFQRSLPANIINRVINLCGKTDWAALAGAIKGLDLLLSPDTGTMHLGAFLGTPVMAFFLSSAYAHETGPYGKGHLIWQIRRNCSPCLENAPCTNGLDCLSSFQDASFPRFLAAAILHRDEILRQMPSGLQLWKTDFDDIGQKLVLQAGNDPYEQQRKIVRELLKSYLFKENNLMDFDHEEVMSLTEMLYPPQEWMLPCSRYC